MDIRRARIIFVKRQVRLHRLRRVNRLRSLLRTFVSEDHLLLLASSVRCLAKDRFRHVSARAVRGVAARHVHGRYVVLLTAPLLPRLLLLSLIGFLSHLFIEQGFEFQLLRQRSKLAIARAFSRVNGRASRRRDRRRTRCPKVMVNRCGEQLPSIFGVMGLLQFINVSEGHQRLRNRLIKMGNVHPISRRGQKRRV